MRKHFRTVAAVAALAAGIGAVLLPSLALASGSAKVPTFSAKLTGKAEVPPVSSSSSGNVTITLDPKIGKVCWTFTLKGVPGALTAHVLRAAPGKTGPAVIRLGGRYSPKGCSGASIGAVKAVVASPGAYYVNVQTAKHLNGAIRGQLHR